MYPAGSCDSGLHEQLVDNMWSGCGGSDHPTWRNGVCYVLSRTFTLPESSTQFLVRARSAKHAGLVLYVDNTSASVELLTEPGCMMFSAARRAAFLALPTRGPPFKLHSSTLSHDWVVVKPGKTPDYATDLIQAKRFRVTWGSTITPINDLDKAFVPCRCGVITIGGGYDPLATVLEPLPKESWVESCFCDIKAHNFFAPQRESPCCTLDSMLLPSAAGLHPTRVVTYDCLHLRQHRLEVVTGDAGAVVVLSATLDSKDWVFFVGAKCRGRPPGPFACRFLTVIQQKDVEPTQRARLVVWRLHVPVPWRAHVCCTPALIDVLHCALRPDAGLVAPDVISTVLLTLVLHHVADGSAHEIVRRTLDRLACDRDALKDLPSLLWLCLATATLPPSCVSSLVVVTAKRVLMTATERVQDPISVLWLK